MTDIFEWTAIPDWFYWGPRATMKFDLRSGSTPEPEDDTTVTVIGDASDGSAYDGPAAWDGDGDSVDAAAASTTVGEQYTSPVNKLRGRAYYKFDISGIPNNALINHATLHVYYSQSYGNGFLDATPNSGRVGHVVVDHIEDWEGALVPADFQVAAKQADVGTIVGDDGIPGRWVALDVTERVQEDLDEQDTPDTSCFRLRQSLAGAYAPCANSNLWQFISANSAGNRPRLTIKYNIHWTDWLEAQDNKEFEHTLRRYVQHRFYAWIPQDVRFSRNLPVLPEFIYRHFVLKWWGSRFRYEYRYRDEYYPFGPIHVWGYTPIIWGQYRFANDAVISPTLYDELPVFEV